MKNQHQFQSHSKTLIPASVSAIRYPSTIRLDKATEQLHYTVQIVDDHKSRIIEIKASQKIILATIVV